MTWQPRVIGDLFTSEERLSLLTVCDRLPHYEARYDQVMGRLTSGSQRLIPYLDLATHKARDVFGVSDLLPSYALWALYDVPGSNLHAHKDDNACTYTLDYCVRQRAPWSLYVEGIGYDLQEDEALAFLGEEQEHWRSPFTPGNAVEMIFFHFVRPDHWYYNSDAPRPERFADFVSGEVPCAWR